MKYLWNLESNWERLQIPLVNFFIVTSEAVLLNYIKKYSIQNWKMIQSFVCEALSNHGSEVCVVPVINPPNLLGMQAIAKGGSFV